MTTKSDDIVGSLRNNLKRIIHLYEDQKNENKKLQAINVELNNKLSSLARETEELKQNNNNTELTNAFISASGSSHIAKIKVNRIVREIDKCIALLNK